MLSRLSEAQTRHLIILGMPLVITAAGLSTYATGGYRLALAVTAVVTVALLALAWMFRPKWWGNTRVQALSLILLSGLASGILADALWLPLLARAYEQLRQSFPDLPQLVFPDALATGHKIAILIFVGLVFIVLNYIWSRYQILPPSDVVPARVAGDFPIRGYAELRDEFCEYMLRQLDSYDVDLNWSDSDYATLEAEVEMDRRGARRPRVVRDLVAAIRMDQSTRAFLVLGDPGSGKSVSLRRLCRELYGVVGETGIVPVYVNLREWDGPPQPSDEDIAAFIKKYLKGWAGRAGTRFLNEWYDRMLDHGRFFFLLDSFDEMPSVLDCDDTSPRLKEISRAFDRFFHDIHSCRGVLASRRFRQPRGFRGRRLIVRPFSETQIRKAMARWLLGHPFDADAIVRELFANRPELVPAIRNPFLADLTTQYVIHHHGELPPSHFAIYQDHVDQRLAEDAAELEELGLEPEQVLTAATEIAWAMYQEPTVGLDVEVTRLGGLVEIEQPNRYVQALRLTRIARLGGRKTQQFSFVHRRFAEFFVVRSIIENKREVPFQSIPEDSRWRDCLVVYCGVAPEEEAKRIAAYCWKVIKENEASLDDLDVRQTRPVVHCLRFLRDAFLSRAECIDDFRGDLSRRILDWLGNNNILVAKIAAEAMGLLKDVTRSNGIQIAFQRNVPWLSETTLRACRHLDTIGPEARMEIRRYVRTLPTSRLFTSSRSLLFSLSLSEGLKGQRLGVALDVAWVCTLWLISVGIVAISIINTEISLSQFVRTSVTVLSIELIIWSISYMLPIDLEKESRRSKLDALLVKSSTRIGRWFARYLSRYPLLVSYLEAVRELSRPGKRDTVCRRGFDTSLRVSIIILITSLRVKGSTSLAFETYCLLLVILLPWEFWLVPFRLNFLAIKRFVRSACLAAPPAVLFVVILYLTLLVVDSFKRGLTGMIDIIQTLRPGAILALPLFLGSIFALFVIGYTCFLVIVLLRDIGRINRASDATGQLSRKSVHQTCRQLHTEWARHRFLHMLRLANVEATDDPIPLPDEPWVDARVRMEMAKLESMWNGLDE